MPLKSLLFIPDITGFTDFVNRTEIEHSQHIISELLENIIDSNQLNLEVSEIEGDAVFFYKSNNVPGLNEVYDQACRMFIDFHSHLKLYDKHRICQCGACSSASRLSLKFIVHSAEIGFTNIKNKRKPFGADIVLLHKLLKNNVDYGEYILFTNAFLEDKSLQIASLDAVDFENGFSEYESIGLVNYKYIPLSHLHRQVPDPPPVARPKKMKHPYVMEHVFDMPVLDAYESLSNFELKKKWNADVNEFKYEKNKVNRVGTKHICVFEKGQAEFESVTNDFGADNLVYGEKLMKFPLANDFTFYFILSPEGEKTRIRLEIHYRPYPLVGWMLKPIINGIIKKLTRNFIHSFSKLENADKIKGAILVNEPG